MKSGESLPIRARSEDADNSVIFKNLTSGPGTPKGPHGEREAIDCEGQGTFARTTFSRRDDLESAVSKSPLSLSGARPDRFDSARVLKTHRRRLRHRRPPAPMTFDSAMSRSTGSPSAWGRDSFRAVISKKLVAYQEPTAGPGTDWTAARGRSPGAGLSVKHAANVLGKVLLHVFHLPLRHVVSDCTERRFRDALGIYTVGVRKCVADARVEVLE